MVRSNELQRLRVTLTGIFGLFLVPVQSSGLLEQIKFDQSCVGAKLHDFSVTDCSQFPCTIKRGKDYTITALFSTSKDIEKPDLKCGTIYLGREYGFKGLWGCDKLDNGTCPLTADTVYRSSVSFNIPYYVPPILYNVWCKFTDDEGKFLMCGSGSGRVV